MVASSSSEFTVDDAGDALLLAQFRNYTRYHIEYSRKIGNTCFRHFPITLPYDNRTYFLELTDRRLVRSSPQIACDQRPPHTYVTDHVSDEVFEISATGDVTLQPTKVNEIKSTPDNPFPQIRGYDQRILITQPEK